MHQVNRIFLSLGILASLPVILSSAFCLTEQVSKIIISASSNEVFCHQIFCKTVDILAESA
jgi:hypothetical protein